MATSTTLTAPKITAVLDDFGPLATTDHLAPSALSASDFVV